MNSFELADIERRLSNLIRPGTIAALDADSARVRVAIGELTTEWLPFFVRRAGMDIEWWAPEVGEQVLVLSPSGELAQGYVLAGINSDAKPAAGDAATVHRVTYADGAVIEYDRAAHKLKASGIVDFEIQASGAGLVDCPQTTFTGAVTVQGLLTYQAGMTGSGSVGGGGAAVINGPVIVSGGDVTADGISLKTHVHGGVDPGGGNTSGPV